MGQCETSTAYGRQVATWPKLKDPSHRCFLDKATTVFEYRCNYEI